MTIFLDQLRRALEQKAKHGHDMNAAGLRLMDRVIWERYCLCLDMGLSLDANAIVMAHRLRAEAVKARAV